MAGLGKRLVGLLLGVDEGLNALGGGSPRETISGTVGRAAQDGRWWAVHLAQPAVNFIMRSATHCQDAAADEAERRLREAT